MSKIIVRDKLQTIPLHSLTPYVVEKNSNLGNHGLEIVSQRDQVRLLREAKKNHLKNDV